VIHHVTTVAGVAAHQTAGGRTRTECRKRKVEMRRFIIASHERFASGLKSTLAFLSGREDIVALSAYVDDIPLEQSIKEAFAGFGKDDEVVILTDMLQGSVNQKLHPYINDHVHLICGVNVPCAMSFALQPDDEPFTPGNIRAIIDAARAQILYVNEVKSELCESDE
jgi:mannose/fructose-specific phosphotransferase system component IIA